MCDLKKQEVTTRLGPMHSIEEPKKELFERGTVSKGNKRKNTTKYTIGEGRTDKRCC
jgi:hypothetical protein